MSTSEWIFPLKVQFTQKNLRCKKKGLDSHTLDCILLSASALQIFLGLPVEDILEHSREVFKTMGEWELLDITVYKHHLNVAGEVVDPYDELSFYVRNILCHRISSTLFCKLVKPINVSSCVDNERVLSVKEEAVFIGVVKIQNHAKHTTRALHS